MDPLSREERFRVINTAMKQRLAALFGMPERDVLVNLPDAALAEASALLESANSEPAPLPTKDERIEAWDRWFLSLNHISPL